jgi:GNAT superfamily N-acetyltransferase
VRMPGLHAAAAWNLAGWHEAHLRALGFATQQIGGLWLTTARVPVIFFSAIALRPGASAAIAASCPPRNHWVAVSDPWCDLHLDAHGFTAEGDQGWMVRNPRSAAGAVPPVPAELQIEHVDDPDALHDFELASAAGFGSEPQPRATWHAPAILDDPRFAILRGRVEGRTVATSMSFRDAGVLGVYGVATLPEARRRGYGAAMTSAALGADLSIPAVLQPSEMAESLYGRLGFERFTTFRSWARPPIVTGADR